MGGDEGPDHFKAHRLVNAWEFAKLARQSAELGRYVIAAGDFNSVPTAPPMIIITSKTNCRAGDLPPGLEMVLQAVLGGLRDSLPAAGLLE